MNFFTELTSRNETLFWFGACSFAVALICVVLSFTTDIVVSGANAWYKPVKFGLSIGIFAWTMGWILPHLNQPVQVRWFSWTLVLLFGFELAYIALMAGRGMLSHFNVSTPLYGFLFGLMGVAAAVISGWTAVFMVQFFKGTFPDLPVAYLWGIRLGLVLFVIFSFEGFLMGSRLSHTIGGADGGPGLRFLGWSVLHGDPRVPHFIGMHALQVLPLLGFYVVKEMRWLWMVAGLYAVLAAYTLVLALNGKPVVRLESRGPQTTRLK